MLSANWVGFCLEVVEERKARTMVTVNMKYFKGEAQMKRDRRINTKKCSGNS